MRKGFINGELFPTIFISFKFPLQCKAKLQPALNVLIVFSFKLPLRLFMDKSSEIKISLKPILLRINLINFFECVTQFYLSI